MAGWLEKIEGGIQQIDKEYKDGMEEGRAKDEAEGAGRQVGPGECQARGQTRSTQIRIRAVTLTKNRVDEN